MKSSSFDIIDSRISFYSKLPAIFLLTLTFLFLHLKESSQEYNEK